VETPDGYRVGRQPRFVKTFHTSIVEKERQGNKLQQIAGLGELISAVQTITTEYQGLSNIHVKRAFEGCGGNPERIPDPSAFDRGFDSLFSEAISFLFTDGAIKYLDPEDPDNPAICLWAIFLIAKAKAFLIPNERNYWNGVMTATYLLAAEFPELKIAEQNEPLNYFIGSIKEIGKYPTFTLKPPFPVFAKDKGSLERVVRKTKNLLASVYGPPSQTKKQK